MGGMWNLRFRIAFVTVVAVAVFTTLVAATAGAVVKSLDTFKTEIDVDLKITERSVWDGIYPGCYAPQEKFNQTYTLDFDSKPGRKSKIKSGTTTLFPSGYGTTASFGDKGSLKQSGKSGEWELQVANPASCNSGAPPVPSWATSPGCKKINERVMASVVGASGESEGGKVTDGSIILYRVAKPKASSKGASIGASCWRTLHNTYFSGIDQVAEIGLRNTFLQIPVPGLQQKLTKIAGGSAKSKPSFKVRFGLSGDCNTARMTPTVGDKQNYTPIVGSLPHQALGHIFEQTYRSSCMISGSGSIVVRRVAPTRTTVVPASVASPFAFRP